MATQNEQQSALPAEGKPAATGQEPLAAGVVLAMFGTTVESALTALLAIKKAMVSACPQVPVRLAFTSNQIRRIWHRRAADPDYLAQHQTIPAEILHIQGVLATIANLQDRGFDSLVVQSVHMVPAEEFHDLASYVRGLVSIRTMKPRWQPFKKLVLGRPALGAYNLLSSYAEDIRQAALALADDARMAREQEAALVYMGHGNPYFPAGGLYLEFAARMRELYPEVLTLIATVEGFPSFDEIVTELQRHSVQRVMLKPLLVVAGEHALRDLAGSGEASWASRLITLGYEVIPVLHGLGSQPPFAQIFVRHALEAAATAAIRLH